MGKDGHDMRYELQPLESQKVKSFYKKAYVEDDETSKTLISYGTPVIRILNDGSLIRLWPGWSATSGRHIKAFCGISKHDFLQMPCRATTFDKASAYSGTLFC